MKDEDRPGEAAHAQRAPDAISSSGEPQATTDAAAVETLVSAGRLRLDETIAALDSLELEHRVVNGVTRATCPICAGELLLEILSEGGVRCLCSCDRSQVASTLADTLAARNGDQADREKDDGDDIAERSFSSAALVAPASSQRDQSPADGPRRPAAAHTAAQAAASDDKPLHSIESMEREDADTLGAIPDYPTDALPEAAQQLVRHGERSGLPAALVGGAALAALAAAIGPGADIEITPSWHERAILWVPLLAPRGAGKSPSQDLAFAPLRSHDAQLEEDDGGEVLLGDTTLEALARDLNAADGAATLELDELAVLLRGMGEYKGAGGGDRGRFLGLWTGGPWNYRRVGSSGKSTNGIRLRIHRPTLVICGGLQPALHDLLGGEEDGLRPRWFPHLAVMPNDIGELGTASVPADWQALLGELLSLRGDSRTWKFNAKARKAFEEYRKEWKHQARGHESASTSAALVKADIHLGRVAEALAEADRPGEGGEAGAEVIHCAAALVGFTLDCWRALPEQGALALSRRDETLDRGITRLVAWLEEHGGKVSRRELQRARVAGMRTRGDLDQLLARYEATHPGSVTEARQEHGGLPAVIVAAPRRRASTAVSPNGDTGVSADRNAREHRRSGGVGSGDTASGDTESGDTTPEAPRGLADAPETPANTEDSGGAPSGAELICPYDQHRSSDWWTADRMVPICGICHPPADPHDPAIIWREARS